MKVKILIDDVETEVTIKGLKGKHKKQFLKKISELSKIAKTDELAAVGEMEGFIDYQDELALEVIDISKEQYEDLEIEEANKILSAIRESLFPSGTNPLF